MRTTFKNPGNDPAKFKADSLRHLKYRIKAFKAFMKAADLESVILDGDSQSFYDYGLSIVYQLPENKKEQAYLKYLLSWGGPSDEIRFYYNPGNITTPYQIEYVYLDWFTGIGYDITDEPWAQWLADWFNEVGTVESEIKRSINE